MRLQFVGQGRKDADNPTAASADLINCYREPYDGGHVIKSVPGMSVFAGTNGIFMRDMAEIEGDLWVVGGGRLNQIGSSGAVTDRGAVDDGESTVVGNNGNVCVAAGGTYYVWDGAVLHEPTGGAFEGAGSVDFVAQQTVITEPNGRRFQWTDVADPLVIDPLNFATAEGQDDNIIRGMVIAGNQWLFKEKSTEIWYPTGDGFERISGGVIDIGLKSYGLIARLDNAAVFVGDDGIVYLTSGAGLQPVSTSAVETDIIYGQPARAFYYEDEGHKFAVIRLSDRRAWCYDISTGEWHRRGYGPTLRPWPVVSAAKAFGRWHTGSDLGVIYSMARTNTDDIEMRRVMVSRTLERAGTLAEVEFHANVGQLADMPEIMVRVSRNRGMTWGSEKRMSMGALGDYTRRLRLRAQGWGQNHTIELAITDPVDVQMQAEADVVLT